MPKPDTLQGSLDLLVLKILSRRPKLHGYAIMSAIENTSGEVLRAKEGTLYPALHRMEEAGWIRAEWVTKDAGTLALIMLHDALPAGDSAPDQFPVTRLFFFVAPSPRAHLEILAQLSAALSQRGLRRLVLEGAPDADLFASLAGSGEPGAAPARREAGA